MSATLVSSNVTVKIGGLNALNYSYPQGLTAIGVYTCPSNTYAEVYVKSCSTGTGPSKIEIGADIIMSASGAYSTPAIAASFSQPKYIILPGQTITLTSATAGNTIIVANIIEYINTP